MKNSAIVGYVDPLVSFARDKPAVKVSCSSNAFTSRVFRLQAGYHHAKGPPVSHKLVDEIPEQAHQGTLQFSRIGSYARITSWPSSQLDTVDSVSMSFWCQATLPLGAGHVQFLFASIDSARSTGFECLLDDEGELLFRVGGAAKIQEARFSTKLVRHQWFHLRIVVEPSAGIVILDAQAKARDIGEQAVTFREERRLPGAARIASERPLTIASDSTDGGSSTQRIGSSSFNGKIDRFKLETSLKGSTETLLDFDFSLDIPSDRIQDVSNGFFGELINGPSRAATGHDWDASQSDWTRAQYGYGAVHFHDDDLDDAQWATTFELDLPHDLRSGCYAVFVDDGGTTDWIPFFIKPDPETKKVPPVALIIPTFTYAGKGFHQRCASI